MDLKQLEYFVRVAELGSFTRASHALQVAQPALSRQIRLLEVELRQSLLVRNGRGALPTEAGRLLLEHGRGILHQVERAREDLGQVRGALAGRVAIGLPPTLARTFTVPLTRAFRAQLPQAQLSISEGLSSAMLESLTQGRLDLAVVHNGQPTHEVDLEPLFEEELVLVQARQPGLQEDPPPPPLPLRQMADWPLVIPSRPNAIRMLVESELAKFGCRPHIALEIDGVSAILDLVADGMGCAILPRNAVERSVRPSAYSTRTLSEPALRSRLWLASSSVRPGTHTLEATTALIRAVSDQLFGWDAVRTATQTP